MTEYEVKFKNLNIGYYFIYEGKAFQKTTDHSAIQLFSQYDSDLFTKENSLWYNVDSQLKYIRPASVNTLFEPDDIVKFTKRKDLKKIISELVYENRKSKKFREFEVGSYLYDSKKDIYYKKVSYSKVIPIYKAEIGLENNENVVISTISSAINTTPSVNKMFYNGNELISYNFNAWNIVWFDKNFTSYKYESFDTELNYDSESKRMIKFIAEIPNDSVVFLLNSNNSQRCTNLYSKESNSKSYDFIQILKDNEEALNIFEQIGFTENIINSIGCYESILLVSVKNNEILTFKKLDYPKNNKPLYHKRWQTNDEVLEYTYTYNQSIKELKSGYTEEKNLDDMFYVVSQEEMNINMLYNISLHDPKYAISYDKINF